ncbi:post-GPI attachment to proteins factor 2-like [Tropilaelaps mercedesae]|uniref:Post-GPI attachment to proteins factor 2-like n=1 Tax=Tropilaelaps mercedesae TaxID=418985 RepID=A0A1V9XS74_9ACAR|nr:post-GPI attachment to proteins factor 2-like [Tropilaelaps mercedesae]
MSRSTLATYSASSIALYVVALPMFSFIFCIGYSLVFNFTASTQTHCKVTNLLPSISAAIGSFSPQKYVWRTGIGIHSAPRFVYAVMYRSWHRTILPVRYRFLADVAFALEFIEDTSLLGLTMVSSSENYPVHEKCFITFLLTSIAYMCLCAFVLPRLQQHRRGGQHRQSLLVKRRSCITTLVCSALCAFTFYRHNAYCEPYMYTVFALAEYLIVLSNMAFHATAYYDFDGAAIVVGSGDADDDAVHLLKRTAFS